MAGPLGEMFDHGCDALNTTLEVILASYALNLGRSWWTVASLIATHANFYLTTWEEYHTGQLYLGVFSGPVEGILMIVFIFILTGIFGPSFWDKPLHVFLPFLSSLRTKIHVPIVSTPLPDLPLNVCFMIFGAVGLAFNILTSYHNVRKSMRVSASHVKSSFHPLILLLPFLFPPFVHVLWLAQTSLSQSQSPFNTNTDILPSLLHSPLFLPFMCAWGLQFAHQVGRMILSHVVKMPFPMWDNVWLVGLVGAVDACLPRLFGIRPVIQRSAPRTAVLVFATLAVSAFVYVRFCYNVIKDVTEYLGIACFTVRKKDEKGVWRRAGEEPAADGGAVPMNGMNGTNGVNGLHGPVGGKRKM
ncbi:hypothetical protein AX15_007539 [Amanita polypyramis BW_CC]|nr:hypothetical protein AX15_007539 [Amanita polypyramis BW_CC]